MITYTKWLDKSLQLDIKLMREYLPYISNFYSKELKIIWVNYFMD